MDLPRQMAGMRGEGAGREHLHGVAGRAGGGPGRPWLWSHKWPASKSTFFFFKYVNLDNFFF